MVLNTAMRPTATAPLPTTTKGAKRQKRASPRRLPSSVRPACGGTAARLCVEGDAAVVYHCLANESEEHAASAAGAGGSEGAGRIELPLEAAPALELLLGVHSARPGLDPVRVADLPGWSCEEAGDDEEGLETAAAVRGSLEALLEAGVVVEVEGGGGEEEEKKEKEKEKRKTKKKKRKN